MSRPVCRYVAGMLAVAGLAGTVDAQSRPAGVADGLQLAVGRLDSSGMRKSRPGLFVSMVEIAQARVRLTCDARAKAACDRFIKEADGYLSLEIKPLDEGWWQSAKAKTWDNIYPEVFENTFLAPNKYAKPAVALATAWLLTGKDAYAEKATALVMNLVAYSFQAEHYDVGMNYAIWGVEVLQAYDALGPRMSADQRSAVNAFMTRLAAAVAKNDAYWMANNVGGGINNHLAWHKAMLGLLGLFYDRPEYVEYCLNGRRGLVSLLEDGLIDDGLWCESSLVYQFAAIAPMVVLADCQQRVGQRPGLHEIVGANGRTLKQSCDAMFHVLAPNGMIPPIGDAYGSRAKLWDNPLYEYAWGLWRDPRYAWLLARSREPSVRCLFVPPPSEKAAPPPIRSILLPEHGYAFLRSDTDERYWSPDAWCAFLTYDRSNVHANADKLSLMLFGQDRMLLADVEGKATVPHAFSSRIQRELNRGGLSQNTVMIDGRDQVCGPRILRLIEYRDLPDEKRVTAADEEGLLYEGVRQMRTVAMTADYVLDVFQVQCRTERQIDWIAHALSEKATMPADGNEALKRCEPFFLPREGAWQWLRDGRSFLPQGPVRLEWREEQARLRLYMLPDGVERVILCGYPATDEPQSSSVPMVIVRQRGKQAIFAAVWLIGDGVKNVESARMPDHEGRLVFRVSADGRQRRHLVPILTGVN